MITLPALYTEEKGRREFNMRDSVYRFTLDVHSIESQVQIVAKKNDNARKIVVTLMEDGKPYAVDEGCKAVFMMKKPDATVLYNDCDITNSGSSISYDFTSKTTTSSGLCDCEFRVYGTNSELITAPRFTMLVSTNVYEDGQISSTSEYTALTNAVVGANNLDIDSNNGSVVITKKDGTKKTVFETTQTEVDLATEEELDVAKGRISTLETSMSAANTHLTAIDGQITTINSDIDSLESHVSTIEDSTVPAIKGRLTAVEGKAETNKTDIATLNNTVSGIGSDVTTLKGNVVTINTRLGNIDSSISTIEGDVDSLESDVTAAEGNIDAIQGNISTISGQISTINSTLSDKQDKLIAGSNIVIASDGRTISAIGGGETGSTVSMEDYEGGGVKLIVDGEYKIIAKESEIPSIATSSNPGTVKPDGTTITVSDDGKISAVQEIADGTTSTSKTWSSSKISDEESILSLSGESLELATSKGGVALDKVSGKLVKSPNLLKPTLATTTTNGVTCTNNGDGTYTLSGTATNHTYLTIASGVTIKSGYKLVGFKSGINGFLYSESSTSKSAYGEDRGSGFVYSNIEAVTNAKIIIYIAKNATCSNDIIKPMLTTDTTLTYADYIPYGIHTSGSLGCVDLGTLDWTYNATLSAFRAKALVGGAYYNGATCYCAKYRTVYNTAGIREDMTISINAIELIGAGTCDVLVHDNTYGNNTTAFKNAMKGVFLAYEVADGSTPSAYAEVIQEHSANLLKPTLATTTTNGVTCTNNGDGTFTVNGTASATTVFYLTSELNLPSGTLKVFGCPIGGTDDTYKLVMYPSVTTTKNDYGSGFTFNSNTTTETYRFYIRIQSGYTCNKLIFKPMLTTDTALTYSDYVPYETYTDVIPLSAPLGNGDFIDGEVEHHAMGTRAYQSGDESDTSVVTDGTITWYELATPNETTLSTEQVIAMHSLKAYDGKTYIDTTDVYAKPTLSVEYGTTQSLAIENSNLVAINKELASADVSDVDARVDVIYEGKTPIEKASTSFTTYASIVASLEKDNYKHHLRVINNSAMTDKPSASQEWFAYLDVWKCKETGTATIMMTALDGAWYGVCSSGAITWTKL